MKKFLTNFLIFFFIAINPSLSEVIQITDLNELKKMKKNQKITVLISTPILVSEDLKIFKNINLKFIDNGKFILNRNSKLKILGKIVETEKKIFEFIDKNEFKNLIIEDKIVDVRWFGIPEDPFVQIYSGYHNKTMFFDDYTIDNGFSFLHSNLKAYFNNTLITGTFHFSDHPADPNKKFLENIYIDGIININGRLGGLMGKNIFINHVNILKSDNYRPAGVHIYSGIENLRINKLIIEDSIRHYALGIDSSKPSLLPKNIFIDEVIIRDSSVHGAFINGENIEINKIIIESFGNLKKSKFSKEIKKNLNFTSKFKYLDLFEVTPKGLIIGEGFNIKLNNVSIKTKNFSITNLYNFFRIKKFLVQPSIYYVDFTNSAKVDKIFIQIPTSIKIVNKLIIFFRDKIIVKIFSNFDQINYKINNSYMNIWPFEIENIN